MADPSERTRALIVELAFAWERYTVAPSESTDEVEALRALRLKLQALMSIWVPGASVNWGPWEE